MERPDWRLYRTFVLRGWPEAGIAPEELPVWCFTMEEVSPPHMRRAFGTPNGKVAMSQLTQIRISYEHQNSLSSSKPNLYRPVAT